MNEFRRILTGMHGILSWLYGEAREKVSIRETWKSFKELQKTYGLRFFIAAVIWEFVIEDGLFPLLAIHYGHPELAVLFLFIHFEPIVFPCILWGFKMYDRFRGRIPWSPDRPAMSTYWRTALKVLSYRIVAVFIFWGVGNQLSLNKKALLVYLGVMLVFSYDYDRIWHDWNWGITPDDQVLFKRTLAKACGYRVVSSLVMGMVFTAFLSRIPWGIFVGYQGIMLGLALGLEWLWSRSSLGIVKSTA